MDRESFERGKRDAADDIAAGKPRLFYATRSPWGEFFCELMMSRFGVAVQHIDCFTSEVKQSYEAGYNGTITSYIDEVHSEHSFERALEELKRFRDHLYQRAKGGS